MGEASLTTTTTTTTSKTFTFTKKKNTLHRLATAKLPSKSTKNGQQTHRWEMTWSYSLANFYWYICIVGAHFSHGKADFSVWCLLIVLLTYCSKASTCDASYENSSHHIYATSEVGCGVSPEHPLIKQAKYDVHVHAVSDQALGVRPRRTAAQVHFKDGFIEDIH